MSGSAGELSAYPLDAASLLALVPNTLARQGTPQEGRVPHQASSGPQATLVAQEALVAWNICLATGDEEQRTAFLTKAVWLREQATLLADDLAGWPVLTRVATLSEPVPLLSATAQGLALSVLVRAYQMTSDDTFWRLARRAVRAFERDIFDGGVCAPIGDAGVFFEEAAAYPASHRLCACLVGLYSLHEYLVVADDANIADLVRRALQTISTLAAFDAGYWSRADLASRWLASPAVHALHIALLKALADASGDAAWAALAARWAGYQRHLSSRLRYFLSSKARLVRKMCGGWLQRRFLRGVVAAQQESPRKVCVPITAFPVAGGMRAVLAGIAQAMANDWEIEYLAQRVGPHDGSFTIHSFGNEHSTYWHFPNVWFYAWSGWLRLLSLLRRDQRYHLIFPQDGVFSGAYAALAAKLAGVRVISMDHGTITLPSSPTFRAERLRAIASASLPVRLLSRVRYACYWPSLRLLIRLANSATDYFLPAGDAVEVAYREQFGISSDRLMRCPFLIDTEYYRPCDPSSRAWQRAQLHLPADGVLIAMVNRLAPEKGIDIALQGIKSALEKLPADLRSQVRVVIAGEGPLRPQIEADISRYGLESTCFLWGEQSRDNVALLLSISDLFLFTATRDINSVAVLEAMAAGLPVIASAVPPSKAVLLAEGRGMAIPPGDAEAVSIALAEALQDLPGCRQMGARARAYIETRHSAQMLRRCLLRATGWPLTADDVNQDAREEASSLLSRGYLKKGMPEHAADTNP
ncbi:MAG TPA: glycosyltransferase [Ktedonobacterales bacterium]|nr:glycosyltransferase [Ktedonobacterales bacterium]